jgi:hypothetical protein
VVAHTGYWILGHLLAILYSTHHTKHLGTPGPRTPALVPRLTQTTNNKQQTTNNKQQTTTNNKQQTTTKNHTSQTPNNKHYTGFRG